RATRSGTSSSGSEGAPSGERHLEARATGWQIARRKVRARHDVEVEGHALGDEAAKGAGQGIALVDAEGEEVVPGASLLAVDPAEQRAKDRRVVAFDAGVAQVEAAEIAAGVGHARATEQGGRRVERPPGPAHAP